MTACEPCLSGDCDECASHDLAYCECPCEGAPDIDYAVDDLPYLEDEG